MTTTFVETCETPLEYVFPAVARMKPRLTMTTGVNELTQPLALWADANAFLQWCTANGVAGTMTGSTCLLARAFARLTGTTYRVGYDSIDGSRVPVAYRPSLGTLVRLPEWTTNVMMKFDLRLLPPHFYA